MSILKKGGKGHVREPLVPAYDPVQALETWAIGGGIPYYLEAFDDSLSLLDNARRQILHPRSLLHDEPRLLLMEELREPRNSFSILQAIAHGRTRQNEIACWSVSASGRSGWLASTCWRI